MDHQEAVLEFARTRSTYEAFTRDIEVLLGKILAEAGIPAYAIESRTKSLDSFAEKIQRPGKRYSNPLSEITDLSGVRVILYYLDDVKKACDLIEQEFKVDWENSIDKGRLLRPNEFGYQSVHYVVEIGDERRKMPEWRCHSAIKSEVQVRTILQHAWSAIDHSLIYKSEDDVPQALRRRLFRLSGLLELADEQFEQIRTDRQALRTVLADDFGKGVQDADISVDSILEFAISSVQIGRVVQLATEVGFQNEQSDETHSDWDRDIAPNVRALCNMLGIAQIGGLEGYLESVLDSGRAEFMFRRVLGGRAWKGDRLFFVAVLMVVEAYNLGSDPSVAVPNWHPDVLEIVKEVGKAMGEFETTEE